MVDPLTGPTLRVVLFAILAVAGTARAQVMADPTRPPTDMGTTGTAGAGVAESGPGFGGPALQSVIIRQGAKPRALISGEWVEQGKKVGEMRVLKISPEAVILQGPNGRETLVLTPGVTKQPARTPGGTKK